MAESNYTHGEMNIDAQSSMYSGFMRASAWGSLILLVAVGYMVFTLSIGINWLVSLILMAGAGIAIGVGLGFGGAWIATIVGLAGLALFIQLMITLINLAM
ncbi:aa3-type cytochrome c oxidase subunit IV [Henriciella sp. AS95]|uniref:aa3-type cytochrome c oxidase subunit IV n=1 Tax=Henriciella sp. AS95 TaxID=3135782 RepID=UPI00317018C6